MRELLILLAPIFWSLKNNLLKHNWPFYRKTFLYIVSSGIFITLITKLLTIGMERLQDLPADIFPVLLQKGYSLIFLIIFIIQIINGFIISLNTYYQSKELEILFTSPVDRTSIFFARLLETHLKASWMLIIFGVPLLVSAGLISDAPFYYYLYSFILFLVFSSIPVNIGTGITFVLTRVIHTQKIKRFLFSAGIITLVVIISLFRAFKPETLVNPAIFANLTLFISELKTSSFILLPNRWLSESLFAVFNTPYGTIILFISVLFLTSYMTIPLLLSMYKTFHYKGWSHLQEGELSRKYKKSLLSPIVSVAAMLMNARLVNLFLFRNNPASKVLARKDLTYQIRDVKNIHQILILLSLLFIYFFSIVSLPLNWENIYYATKLRYIISYFNVGLILIIITALCSRIAYPAIVSEGNYLWIIKTAPLTPRRFIWTKFFFFFIPILLFGQLLTVFSSYFIHINRTMFVLKCLTTLLATSSLVSLAVTFSISDMRNLLKDRAQEDIRTGNTLYMIIAVSLIFVTLSLEAIPVFIYFLEEAGKVIFITKTWVVIGGIAGIIVLLNITITAISMRIGMRRLDRIELL